MTKVIIIPGYGDRIDYIKRALQNWPTRFGIEVEVIPFGWSSGSPDSYEQRWQALTKKLTKGTAIIGISAGASVALRALAEYPTYVTAAVVICGPFSDRYLKPAVLHGRYPMLARSLQALSLENIDTRKILTLRPLRDEIVPPQSVVIEGAINLQMRTFGHAQSIVWAIYGRQKTIATFIKKRTSNDDH